MSSQIVIHILICTTRAVWIMKQSESVSNELWNEERVLPIWNETLDKCMASTLIYIFYFVIFQG